MTQKELESKKLEFEKNLEFLLFASRNRNLDGDDFRMLNWTARNLDRLRNYDASELDWDEENKEVLVTKGK